LSDYHHYVGGQSQSNFASVFTYCDYLYGTDKGYRYHKEHILKARELYTVEANGFKKENGNEAVSDKLVKDPKSQ